MGRYSFRPYERLKTPREYQRVKREGRYIDGPFFAVNFAVNGLSHHRLGIIVQKRFWKAVQRNRLKRYLREWFRLNKHKISKPYKDIVVILKPGAETLSASQMADEIMRTLKRENGQV